jgi:hypothetical protein
MTNKQYVKKPFPCIVDSSAAASKAPSKTLSNVPLKAKPATSKWLDTWNGKLNRAHPRNIIHTFRNAFLGLRVYQSICTNGGTMQEITFSSGNIDSGRHTKSKAGASIALIAYTAHVPMADSCLSLRKILSIETICHTTLSKSPEQLHYSWSPFAHERNHNHAWRLVDTTTDGTDLCIYQTLPFSDQNDPTAASVIAIVWKDGLLLER